PQAPSALIYTPTWLRAYANSGAIGSECGSEGLVHPGIDQGSGTGVLRGEHLSGAMNSRHQVTPRVGQQDGQFHPRCRQSALENRSQLVDPLARGSGNEGCARRQAVQLPEDVGTSFIDLVEHQLLRDVHRIAVTEHLAHG